MEERAWLAAIENDRRITNETDSRFLFAYQRAVLLSLKESGVLNEVQYRCAVGKLKGQLQREEKFETE